MQNTGIIAGAPLAVADLSDFDTERAIGVSMYHGFYGYEGN